MKRQIQGIDHLEAMENLPRVGILLSFQRQKAKRVL